MFVLPDNIEFYSKTDKGLHRANNEDACGTFSCENGMVFCVCDGMGGHEGGEIASNKTLEELHFYLKSFVNPSKEQIISEAISYANHKVYLHSLEDKTLKGMGTTLVMAIIMDDKLWYAHAGDSRLYLIRNQKLVRLTKDHSFVQKLVDQGLLLETDAHQHPRASEIVKAIGVEEKIEPSICAVPIILQASDTFLLCTDGLTNMLSDKEIEDILTAQLKTYDAGEELVKMALEKGGHDNITAQIIKVKHPDERNLRFIPNKIAHFNSNHYFIYTACLILFLVFFLWLNKRNHSLNTHTLSSMSNKHQSGITDSWLDTIQEKIYTPAEVVVLSDKANLLRIPNSTIWEFEAGQSLIQQLVVMRLEVAVVLAYNRTSSLRTPDRYRLIIKLNNSQAPSKNNN